MIAKFWQIWVGVILLVLTLVSCSVDQTTRVNKSTPIPDETRSSTIPEVVGAESTIEPTDMKPLVKPSKGAVDSENHEANADVLFVSAIQLSDGTWNFSVTVEHPDTGWEDYADGWDVVLPDGSIAKPDLDSPFTRLLLHPHETEQPFTRSQSGIAIAPGVTEVTVRAHDLVDGFGGREVIVDLTSSEGVSYEVQRLSE